MVPALLGLAVAIVALSSLGLAMTILLSIFGVDPISTLAYVVISDPGTAAGLTGAMSLTIAMWASHVIDRRLDWTWWVAAGVIGYVIGALAITSLVPQITPA